MFRERALRSQQPSVLVNPGSLATLKNGAALIAAGPVLLEIERRLVLAKKEVGESS